MSKEQKKIRVLVVDDEPEMLDTFSRVLCPDNIDQGLERQLSSLEAKLFGSVISEKQPHEFELVTCQQGNEAVEAVQSTQAENNPFAVAFIDMRLPPGPNGLWTAKNIRKLDPLVNIIIVTAYSDVPPSEIAKAVQPESRLLYVQKPIHMHEIHQFACALGAKWQAETQLLATNETLETLVKKRTAELALANAALKKENNQHKITEKALQRTETELRQKSDDLKGVNTALTVVIKEKEKEKEQFEKKVLFNIKEMAEPFLNKLKQTGLSNEQATHVAAIESSFNEIVSPFMRGISKKYYRLTPIEIHIANLIKSGKKTKEMSKILGMSLRTIEFHRDRIRAKIGIKNTRVTLKKSLRDIDLDLQVR